MSNPPAHWEKMDKIVKLRNKINPKTLLLGNGDVTTRKEAHEKIKKYNIDGVMIGRGIFHDPFIFTTDKTLPEISQDERIELLLKHSSLFDKTWGEGKHFAILKKFFKIYTLGLPNAVEIRTKFMEAENYRDVEQIAAKM
jgi:tRNA-dihydrouridine synthase